MDDAAVRTGPSTARWSCNPYAIVCLMWSLSILAPIVVFYAAGRRWSLVATGVGTTVGMILLCKCLNTGPDEPGQHQVNGGGVGLSQGDIEAIPADADTTADSDAGVDGSSSSSVEECAVCLSVLQSGETVRRLPECGHAFHARCINGWLRGHATCPICRARIKVVAGDGDGEPSSVAAAV